MVTKRGIGAFTGTELDRLLRIRRVDTCHPLWDRHQLGRRRDRDGCRRSCYRVIVPEDCSASVTAEMHQFAIEKVLPDIATICTAVTSSLLSGGVEARDTPIAGDSGEVWHLTGPA